jgi:hypothetical protein
VWQGRLDDGGGDGPHARIFTRLPFALPQSLHPEQGGEDPEVFGSAVRSGMLAKKHVTPVALTIG